MHIHEETDAVTRAVPEIGIHFPERGAGKGIELRRVGAFREIGVQQVKV